jgi:hypothetical protein
MHGYPKAAAVYEGPDRFEILGEAGAPVDPVDGVGGEGDEIRGDAEEQDPMLDVETKDPEQAIKASLHRVDESFL